MSDEKEKSPVQDALRSELARLVSEGDEKTKELTPEVLLRIMRVAKTGRDLITSLSANPKDLASLVKKPRGFGPGLYGGLAGLDEDLDDGVGGSSMPMPFASAAPAENFGMTVIRELMAAAKTFNGNGPSLTQLVEALAVAREKGLDDVAKELETQLGMATAKPAVPVPAVPIPAVPLPAIAPAPPAPGEGEPNL